MSAVDDYLAAGGSDADEQTFLSKWAAEPDLCHVSKELLEAIMQCYRQAVAGRKKVKSENERVRLEAERLRGLAKASRDAAAVYRDLAARNEILIMLGKHFNFPSTSSSVMALHHDDSAIRLEAAADDWEQCVADAGRQDGDNWKADQFVRNVVSWIVAEAESRYGVDCHDDHADWKFAADLVNLAFSTAYTYEDVYRALGHHRGRRTLEGEQST
jgi:hypothetical protein